MEHIFVAAAVLSLAMSLAPVAQPQTADPVPVTVDNFIRAESDLDFGHALADAGALARFYHHRSAMPIDRQSVIRANRDTLYSSALVDLDAGPVTVTLPDAGDRFRTIVVINEDHYLVEVRYDAGVYTYTQEDVGTRYALLAIRTLVDPDDPADVEAVHALQDATGLDQPGGPGASRSPIGIRRAKARSARRCSSSPLRCPTHGGCSVRRTRSIRSAT